MSIVLHHDEQAIWDELDREAMSASEIDEIAEYLRLTGQASA